MSRSIPKGYDSKPKFGKLVSFQLCAIGKSQKWLANQCNVTPSHISMILAGKANPSNSLIFEMASALGVESGALINALFEAS